MTVICAACGAELAREDAVCAAGPFGESWYCAEVAECRGRREANR